MSFLEKIKEFAMMVVLIVEEIYHYYADKKEGTYVIPEDD